MTNSKFLLIESRIKKELINIDRLAQELEKHGYINNTAERTERLGDEFLLRAVGSICHDFYNSVENIFKIVARYIDESLPEDSDWHLELLQQMAIELPGLRPALVADETRERLNEFRSFRHVFRNVYGFNLIPERMERLLASLPRTIQLLKSDLERFLAELGEIFS